MQWGVSNDGLVRQSWHDIFHNHCSEQMVPVISFCLLTLLFSYMKSFYGVCGLSNSIMIPNLGTSRNKPCTKLSSTLSSWLCASYSQRCNILYTRGDRLRRPYHFPSTVQCPPANEHYHKYIRSVKCERAHTCLLLVMRITLIWYFKFVTVYTCAQGSNLF